MLNQIIEEMKAKITANCGMQLSAEETREVLAALDSPEAVQGAALGVATFVPSTETPAEEASPVESVVIEGAETEGAVELKGPLPEDFPGHAALAEAGINTYHQARRQRDGEGFESIPGIGKATAAKIIEALKG